MKPGSTLYNFLRDSRNLVYSIIDPATISLYRMQTKWSKPIPPFNLRRITAKRSVDDYVKSGQRITKSLIEGVSSTGKDISQLSNVLDFGCGAGRQIQHFSNYKNIKLTGCDPNEDHIKWLSTQYPQASFCVNKFNPPSPFPDESFDLIYSVSVFTHLAEKAQFDWLADLRRILRSGGIALLTTCGEHAAKSWDRDKLRGRDVNEPKVFLDALRQQDFVFYVPESYHQVNKSINPTGKSDEELYGVTLHSQDYILNNWYKYFEVLKIIPGAIDSVQDLVILRKK